MSDSNRFGPIIDPDTVEKAMAATLADFIADYLGEMERLKGYTPGAVARPAGVITSSEFAKWNPDQLPLIVIVSPGLEGSPKRDSGDGDYEARWSVTAAAIVADLNELETRRLMGAYAGAIRACIVQHKRLRSTLHPQGFAQYLEWVDESYGDIPFADSRTLDSCRVVFSVGVENVVRQAGGPRAPSGKPQTDPGPWPGVSGVTVTTDLEALV